MAEDYKYIADLSRLMGDIPPDGILSHSVNSSEELRVTLFGFSAGQKLTEHTASHPAVLHFLEGEAELTPGENQREARRGTWVYIPAHLPHSLRALTKVVMLLLLMRHGA